MRRALPIVAALALPAAARAADPAPPYAQPMDFHLLAGPGGVVERNARFPIAVSMGADVGHRPFGGALGTGVSFSSMTSLDGRWNVLSLGLQGKLDVLYVLASHFWTRSPSLVPLLPLRLLFGGRLGFDVSVSQNKPSTPQQPEAPYVLLFPGAQLFVDFEVPLNRARTFYFIGRAAFDVGLNSDLQRWSALVGLGYGWGGG